MSLPHIEEPTLYSPIIEYLKNLGFDAVGNTIVKDKEPDILFRYGALSFVIEVKVGKPEIVGLKAVAQASDYGRKLGTQNIIILIYPESIRREAIVEYSTVSRVALESNITITTLTEPWTESLNLTPLLFFNQLKAIIDKNVVKTDFASTVKMIEKYATDLNSVVYQIRTDELVSEVVDKLDLFTSIGEIKDSEVAKRQITNLASFLLFNQLLFYHIYKRKSNDSSLPELEEVKELKNIKQYFSKINDIDYRSIYSVNLIEHIPDRKDVIEVLNAVIKAIKLLRAEHITHDLAGRFFHDLIPSEVRKVLAAFYTHPTAADILTGLAIEKWDESVIDPACGSGTLLVSAYNRKKELFENEFSGNSQTKMHKKFIEEDLTGIDLMPFAAHISALNLTMQNIEEKTNTVRIATQDSLDLANVINTVQFKQGQFVIKPYSATIQKSLVDENNSKLVSKRGSLSVEGKGFEFILKPVDLVIMNPPFTDRDKMTVEMRVKLKNNPLNERCGNKINLWGYFLVLGDSLLKADGKIAAIIPVNIARGTSTEKVRKLILENYQLDYIIKPVGDFAFSESAAFKDVLLIARKKKPTMEHLSKIVFLKKSIRDLGNSEVKEIINTIRTLESDKGTIYEDDHLEIKNIPQKDLTDNIDNLMTFIGGTSLHNLETMRTFMAIVKERGKDKLSNFKKEDLKEGITSPKGLGQLVYITVPSHFSREERSFLILDSKKKDILYVRPKNIDKNLEIPLKSTEPALRTITGIQTLQLGSQYDYILKDSYSGFDEMLTISKWKGRFNWGMINDKIARIGKSRLVVPDKIRLSSKNTIVLAAYSDEPIILSNLFFAYRVLDKEVCKTLTLSLNSVINIVQFLMLKAETLGGYIRLSANDWNMTYQLDFNKLNDHEKKAIVSLFKQLKSVKLPSIVEQLQNKYVDRIKIDKTILQILGFSVNEIESILPRIYEVLIDEFKSEKAMES